MNKMIIIVSLLLMAAGLPAAHAASAKAIWKQDCAMCHGPKGNGNTPIGRKFQIPDLQSPKLQASLTDKKIAQTIKEGFKVNGQQRMPAFESKLNEREIKALVRHVRKLKKG